MKSSLRNAITLLRPYRTIATGLVCFGAAAIASYASISHAMDTKESGHTGMDHSGMKQGGMDHSGMNHSGMDHSGMKHQPLMIPAGQAIPTLKLSVEPDAMGGWNLQAAVSNFTFAPERVNQSSLTTEGHAHLSINGEKITRLYAAWYYIPELPPGEHEIRVELNANNHGTLMAGGKAIADTVKITVPAPGKGAAPAR
jgi:hypothetical protein